MCSATDTFRSPSVSRMSWKHDLQLADLDARAMIEITCKRCGHTRLDTPSMIPEEIGRALYLDEVEAQLRCGLWSCDGRVRIALLWEHLVEGWVGGMP